jgi:hypothetical protein
MKCCLGCLMLLGPRLALFSLFLTSDYLGRAYDLNLWPFLGFIFLPWTTLAFAYAQNEGGGLQGPFLALWIVALITDLFFTRQSGSKDSEARIKMTKIVRQKTRARVVDVEVIDVDKED